MARDNPYVIYVRVREAEGMDGALVELHSGAKCAKDLDPAGVPWTVVLL